MANHTVSALLESRYCDREGDNACQDFRRKPFLIRVS